MCFGMEPIPLRKSIGWFLARFGMEIHPSSPFQSQNTAAQTLNRRSLFSLTLYLGTGQD
jgi:hypothetical protein